MPTYDEEVLDDSPLAYWKCDEAEGSTVMADSSGNDRHGQIYQDTTFGGITTLGADYQILGPIETDTPNYGGSSRYGNYPVPTPSALIPTAAFSWEVWGRVISGTSALLGLSGQPGITGSNVIWMGTTGGVRCRVNLGGTGYALNTASCVSGAWYHVVVTRSGTALLLYVNGYLAAQNNSVSSSALETPGNPVQWTVGRVPGTSFYSSDGVARAAIYGSQLSAARVLAHYEAAKLSLPLRATILLSFGVELNTDQVTPTDLGFAHNFSETFGDSPIPIIEELSYKTNVNQSEPDYQQRIGARPHGAYRTLEYPLSPSSGAGRTRLQGALYEPAQTYCLPVWSDAGITTGAGTSGTAIIPVDTTKRDYEVGSYVGVATDLQNPNTYQFHKILTVADAQLTVTANIATTIPSGSPVFPARLVSISEDSLSVKSFAADHEDSVIRFDVLETELSTRRITAYTPGTTYKSIEVFSLESAKVSFLDSRPYDIRRRFQARGRDYQYAVDTGSPQTFPVRFLLTTRAALSEFFGWLDARQGKLNPLWVSTKEKDYIATARPTGTTLTVTKAGFPFHHGRRDLEILKTDGSFTRLRLTAITDNLNGTETLTTSGTFPLLADISKISFLKYCVLASDTVQLRYFKGGANGAVIAECVLSMTDLLTSPA